MLGWLLKLDPNVVVPAVLGIATWLYHKAAGKHAKTVQDIVDGAVGSILAEIAGHIPSQVPIESWLDGARKYVRERIWTTLAKFGITQSPELDRMVTAALEKATAAIAHKIAEERRAKSSP